MIAHTLHGIFVRIAKARCGMSFLLQHPTIEYANCEHLDLTSAPTFYQTLCEIFGRRVSRAASLRGQYTADEGHHSCYPPDIVAFPKTASEISALLALANTARVPVTPWGAGTSLEGNALPTSGGIVLDMRSMDQVLDISVENMTATVQAGVRRHQLNRELKGTGLFFPIDPGADATLGGMAATRASGTNAVKYGTMKTNVLSCSAVLANGEIVNTASLARKSAAGLDLTALIVGSEGTLAVISELTVRLYPIPECTTTLVSTHNNLDAAIATVVCALQCGLDIARIEFLDDHMMKAINSFEKSSFEETFTLFVEFHGSRIAPAEHVATFRNLVVENDGNIVCEATDAEARGRLWGMRHNALYATKSLSAGKKVLVTDVCVPISELAACIRDTRVDLDSSPITATIVGHVGDGNFHALLLVDPDSPTELQEAQRLHTAMALRAIGLGGTCTGEHGIGVGKQSLLRAELGQSVSVMSKIKHALDPSNILNPGKIYA